MRKKCECLPLPLTCHSKYDEAAPHVTPRSSFCSVIMVRSTAAGHRGAAAWAARGRSILMPLAVNTQLNTQRKFVLADYVSRSGRHASRPSGGSPITAPPQDTSLSGRPVIMCKIVELTNKIVKQVCHCPIIRRAGGPPRPNESAI